MFNPKKAFTCYLATLSILGGVVIYVATSKWGPGVSNDSAMLLSTADNLLKGRGLTDYSGLALTQFPPLFPVILALGSLLMRQDVFISGWILTIPVFSALIWFSGIYFFEAFKDEPMLAYFGSFIVFSSTSLIQISANIASDPLFMLIVVFFLMATSAYLRTGRIRYVFTAAALTIIGCFQRYAGLSMVIVGGLIVAYENKNNVKRAILSALLYTGLTAVPIFLWGYLHNAPVNGTVFGSRLPSLPFPNFVTGTEKVLYWFIPYPVISFAGPLVLLAGILGLVILAIFKTNPSGFLKRLGDPSVVPNVAFLLVYFVVLVFDISYYELKGINADRVHIIILPSLLIILLSIGGLLVKALQRRFGSFPATFSAVLLFAIWSIYPISKAYQYVSKSAQDGDVSSYNSINKPALRNSSFSNYLGELDVHGKKVYSNGEDPAWFILRAQVYGLPIVPSDEKQKVAYVQQHYAGWPGPGQDGYLIWFNSGSYKDFLATPHELTSVADVEPLYSDKYGSVYYVKSP